MDFKIIAIRPLEHCDTQYLKVLSKSTFYYLCNDYTITDNNITFTPSIADTLYVLDNGKQINISAIVGKNGSGKSSIAELLYAAVFNITHLLGLLPETDNNGNEPKLLEKIFVEIYYKRAQAFYKVVCQGNLIKIFKQSGRNQKFAEVKNSFSANKRALKDLFYTIVINYSHYSLNERHIGKWVNGIFHKNDGYQTPIVLNPFRNRGIIDINNEEYLTFSRLIANLLTTPIHIGRTKKIGNLIVQDKRAAIRELAPGKVAKSLKLTLNRSKAKFNSEEKELDFFLQQNKIEILDAVFNVFSRVDHHDYNIKDPALHTAYDYILKKIFRITERYAPYRNIPFQYIKLARDIDDNGNKKVKYSLNKIKLDKLLNTLSKDSSHITFKLRQAINFVENYEFYKPKLKSYIEIDSFALELNDLAKTTKKQLIDIIPPSFFNIEIQFIKGGRFSSFSSGEKQKIFSSASLMYHLINLNSVVEGRGHIKYNCVNIIFDEVELYFHPELQRTFVQDFIDNLNKIELPHINGINCVLITHSPFILSDLPNSSILFLRDDGTPDPEAKTYKTFGANIHDLLKHSFFLKNGYMGEFAKRKITSLIDFLTEDSDDNEEWNKDIAEEFINLVAEPIIRNSLTELYYQKYLRNRSEIQKQISYLQELAKTK